METIRSSSVESASAEKAPAVANAEAASAVARNELVRHSQADEDVLKGHIDTLVRENDRQQLHITSAVGELT